MQSLWATVVALIFGRGKGKRASPFHLALEALIREGGVVNVLQIGANDGVINDPLHPFLRAHPDRTQVILAEPQAELIPVLSKAYAFHPRKVILQMAIGSAGRLVLHQVRKACWPDLVVPYARGWPIYRAPTGVTSGRRETLLAWVKQHYRGSLPLDEVIEAVEVESVPTPAALARAGLFERLDVLQIDVEGCDDLVIRASDIAGLKPRLINFEAAHLGPERFASIRAELEGLGYRIERYGLDCLARRSAA